MYCTHEGKRDGEERERERENTSILLGPEVLAAKKEAKNALGLLENWGSGIFVPAPQFFPLEQCTQTVKIAHLSTHHSHQT